MGTAPARFAVERQQWAEAAALPAPAKTPSGRAAWAQANLYYARGLGAARLGKAEAAREELKALGAIREALVEAKEKYWAEQMEIQGEVVAAWIAFAEGSKEDALKRMRAAADHEDATDKHPVTPGVIVPARELLGEMLLELQQPAAALEAFEATLRGAPKRFNALAGAARAAEQAGDSAKAARYSAELVEICGRADAPRPALARAKESLAAKSHD